MATGFTKADFRKGQKVYFGRDNGEQTLGQIEKLNPSKAKVKTLEERGNGRGNRAGAVWSVPYGLMRPADEKATPGTPPPPVKRPPLTYNPFGGIENLILEAMLSCYSALSPENLTADGEASLSHIRHTQAEVGRQLRGLKIALGREVDESEVYGWWGSKTAWDNERRKQKAS